MAQQRGLALPRPVETTNLSPEDGQHRGMPHGQSEALLDHVERVDEERNGLVELMMLVSRIWPADWID